MMVPDSPLPSQTDQDKAKVSRSRSPWPLNYTVGGVVVSVSVLF